MQTLSLLILFSVLDRMCNVGESYKISDLANCLETVAESCYFFGLIGPFCFLKDWIGVWPVAGRAT